jgi:hypothetical protein
MAADERESRRGRLIEVDRLTRGLARRHRNALFAFGDNLAGRGLGGQARALRNEPNAVGIPTKRNPSRSADAYFSDRDLPAIEQAIDQAFERLADHLRRGGDVWWPAAGIGKGRAELPIRAPAVAAHVEDWRQSLEDVASSILPVRHSGRMLVVRLYRPVGPRELQRINDAGFRAFPPRLPEQPIFYPVLEEEYARQIARDWNATAARTGYRGYVTRFDVRFGYLEPYDIHVVGAAIHREYWIPAEDLAEFNRNIVGPIVVIAEYRGGRSNGTQDVDAG